MTICLQGRMLKRAFSKLKLEHVVIEKGQFHQERSKPVNVNEMEVCMSDVSSCLPKFSYLCCSSMSTCSSMPMIWKMLF